jgi:hypothetical protein
MELIMLVEQRITAFENRGIPNSDRKTYEKTLRSLSTECTVPTSVKSIEEWIKKQNSFRSMPRDTVSYRAMSLPTDLAGDLHATHVVAIAKGILKACNFKDNGRSSMMKLARVKVDGVSRRQIWNSVTGTFWRDGLAAVKSRQTGASDAPAYRPRKVEAEVSMSSYIVGNEKAQAITIDIIELDRHGLIRADCTGLVLSYWNNIKTGRTRDNLLMQVTRSHGQNVTGPQQEVLTHVAAHLRLALAVYRRQRIGMVLPAFFLNPPLYSVSKAAVAAQADPINAKDYDAGMSTYRRLLPSIAYDATKSTQQPWQWPLYNILPWTADKKAWNDPAKPLRLEADQGYLLIGWLPPRMVIPTAVFQKSHLYETSLVVGGVYDCLHTDASGQTVSRLITPVGSRSTAIPIGIHTKLRRYLQSEQGRFWTIFCHDIPSSVIPDDELDQILQTQLEYYNNWEMSMHTTVRLAQGALLLRLDQLRHPHPTMARAYFSTGEYPESLLLVRVLSDEESQIPPRWNFIQALPETVQAVAPALNKRPSGSQLIETVGKLVLTDFKQVQDPASVFTRVQQELLRWEADSGKLETTRHLPDSRLVMCYWFLLQEGVWEEWSCPVNVLEGILQSIGKLEEDDGDMIISLKHPLIGRLPWAYFSSLFAQMIVRRFRRTDAELDASTQTLGLLRYTKSVPMLSKKLKVQVSHVDCQS